VIKLRSILSNRWYHRWPSWLMVHEWEDVLASTLQIPIMNCDQNSFESDASSNCFEFDILFLQLAQEISRFSENRQLIPIVMDVWGGELLEFSHHIKKFRLLFVTCLDAFHALRELGCNNVEYLPYSVPDKYILDHVPEKDIDIIQFGRTNPVLDGYMEIFFNKYPDINYVRTMHKDNSLYFHSTRYGIIGESDSREKFMDLLSRSAISLVSTAGMDGSRDTGGFNPVSPRFYESAAGFCRIVGRFPHSEEFEIFGINNIADRVGCYDEFETSVLDYLGRPFDKLKEYRELLMRNTTSRRAPLILNAVSKHDGLRMNIVSGG